MVVVVAVVGGLAFAFVLAAVALLTVAFHPNPAQTTAALLFLAAAVCSLLGAIFVVLGAARPRGRWALPVAALAYTVAGVLCLLARIVHPLATEVWVFAVPAAALALLTPWWWQRLVGR